MKPLLYEILSTTNNERVYAMAKLLAASHSAARAWRAALDGNDGKKKYAARMEMEQAISATDAAMKGGKAG